MAGETQQKPDLTTMTLEEIHNLHLELRQAILRGTDGTGDEYCSKETIEFYESIIADCVAYPGAY
jgi:hypothetical protein